MPTAQWKIEFLTDGECSIDWCFTPENATDIAREYWYWNTVYLTILLNKRIHWNRERK